MSQSILVLERQDDLYQALLGAAPALQAELLPCHQTARASAEMASGRVRVLIAGPTMLTATGVRFLQRAHEEHPDVVTLLVAPKDGTAASDRDLVRIGASDLIRFPAATRTLRSAVERAVELADAMAGSRNTGPEARTTGRAVTITSPTGGCGKTFFATNLAYALASRSGKRVALVDLDLQFGEVVTALRLRPQYTIHDLLATREGDWDSVRAQFREFMVHHPSGVDVLAAPRDPSEADVIDSPDITRTLQLAKELYHYVIVDTPAALTEPVLASFDISEGLIVMATLDVPSVKNLGVFVQTLDRLKIPRDGVSLVLNKAEKDVGLSPAEVQRLFPQGFRGILPYSKEVSRSYNAGRPVLEAAPASDISWSLAECLERILPDEPALATVGRSANGHARAGLLSRLFRRRLDPATQT
ncbi:MAG: AAA family ATPase [Actinomycetota bacterium]